MMVVFDPVREVMVKRMLGGVSPLVLSVETGISYSRLSWWLRYAKNGGMSADRRAKSVARRAGKGGGKGGGGLSGLEKFGVLVEVAGLNEFELASFCRERGLFVDVVREWQRVCVGSFDVGDVVESRVRAGRSEDKVKIAKLERQARKQEKVVAELAALLVLSKKVEAIWGEAEAL